ncbi:site-specific integrase [Burkholderia gladioli]|uniref:site-specific integrase n=1 Tax=Burkholderia gladioli TaxID=28095 RepID=UPI001640BFD2|nr:site-specific integrase [Burkholderia gladioli]MBU9218213.1 site-specific integrase [Burkholderia gladioli]MDN7725347.1 site-specific integrase [Burkholderia gladioli]MDN7920580.1 site-specific integrase [Burkholderia gladioli]
MATINNRGPHQWQATVRRKGYPSQSETHRTKAQAEAWAREVESQMDAGTFRDRRVLAGVTLGDALERYLTTVTTQKRGQTSESNRIKQLQRHPLAQRLMSSLQATDFASYRDQRRTQVGPNTVRLELAVLSHLYTIAIKEWSWPLTHEPKNVSKPKPEEGRERRLEGDEEQRLRAAVHRPKARSAIWLEACIDLALETGMRAGEILSLTWDQIDFDQCCARLEKTKNGSRRTVGLTHKAVNVLQKLPRTGATVITNFYDTSGLDRAFASACKAAGIEGLHFHDLRHEAASRFAPTMQVQDLAKLMGWKTLQMAMRYYNPTDAELVALVRRAAAQPALRQTAPAQPPVTERAPAPSFAPPGTIPTASLMVKMSPSAYAQPQMVRAA